MKKRSDKIKVLSFALAAVLAFSAFAYGDDSVSEAGQPVTENTDQTQLVTEETYPSDGPEEYDEYTEEGCDSSADDSDMNLEGKKEQTIKVDKENCNGIIGEKVQLIASAKGALSYKSSDKKTVKISKDGIMTFLKSGKVKITINAAATDKYAAASLILPVTSFPKKLGVAKTKIAKKNGTRVKLSWNKVKYASYYRLFKYNVATKKYVAIKKLDKSLTSVNITRNAGKYAIRAYGTVRGDVNVKSKKLQSVFVKSPALKAKAYKKAHNIAKYTKSNLDLVRNISGTSVAGVPQSMSFDGKRYIVSYADNDGNKGQLVAYDHKTGKCLEEGPVVKIGHANGSTCNPNTNTIYTVKTHTSYYSKKCTMLSTKTLDVSGSFNLAEYARAIAYDESNNRYYVCKASEIYIMDKNFKIEKTIHKKIRTYHSQDIGAYNGVVLVCTWKDGDKSWVDLYRVSDGAYLGSYSFCFDEIESVVVDDGYLVVIMNHIGDRKDHIYKTKERITLTY